MSAFWETMRSGREASIETMGEEVFFSSQKRAGIVEDMRTAPQLVPGGESEGVVFRIEVTLDVGAMVSDGEPVEVRGYRGRVTGKQGTGGSWWIEVGPASRSGTIREWD